MAPGAAILCTYDGENLRQQAMWIWPGLQIQAAKTDRKHGLKNALPHAVLEADDTTCTLSRENGDTFTVPTADMTKLFRLTYALTIDSSQARTLMGRVLVVETDHKFFSLRRLIVALGSSPKACNVQVQ